MANGQYAPPELRHGFLHLLNQRASGADRKGLFNRSLFKYDQEKDIHIAVDDVPAVIDALQDQLTTFQEAQR